ncbi:spermatogenesis-associated protein 7-like [Rhincodon typus]|uniref:spermatogenesis-associated protein 7-like n=1 Tax=Rhincodon typus TaxID=259920 RepID=UPI00202EA632|nr:spermatogenesis-associated protein 7-like [Rhincodon typus]
MPAAEKCFLIFLKNPYCKKVTSTKKGLQSAMIPKHSLMGPFKGHMCIKSSPFCLGSSCKLSTQFIIQDHLAMHYKSLQSAKATVDSSMPKSMSTSIKCNFTEKSSVPFHLETDCPIWYQSQEMQKLNTRSLAGKEHSSTTVKSKLMAWENEMKYLQFLKEVTDDILLRGYHSNRILENIFQIHVERSKYHLNEDKLKNILQNLRHELQTDLAVSSSEYNAAAVQKTLLLGKTFDRTHRAADKEPIQFKDDDKGKHDWRKPKENSDLTENENIYPRKWQKQNGVENLRKRLATRLSTTDQDFQ